MILTMIIPQQEKNEMAKRTDPQQLVQSAAVMRPGLSWFKTLPPNDQAYVKQVVDEVIVNPNASIMSVAKILISELSINRSVGTVSRTLKEMLVDVQSKC